MREKVKQFLLGFKEIASRKGVIFIRRADSLETLRFLGLTKANLEESLLSLSVGDYCEGPHLDHSGIGEVWIFGKILKGIEVYIKLKIIDPEAVKCISFHISKCPLSYPFKGADTLSHSEEE